jgi:hypothetical protein
VSGTRTSEPRPRGGPAGLALLRAVLVGAGVAVTVGVVVAVVVGVVVGGAGCRRGQPAAAGTGAAPVTPAPPVVAPARLPAARREPPFTHPLLAGATTAVTHENCSRSALGAVVERAQAIEAKADPGAGGALGSAATGTKHAGGACPSPAARETEQMVRGEFLPRVDACVARDGPLDPQWDVVHAAVLSLGVCLDCSRPRAEQAAQCRRARELLAQVAQTPR